MATLPDWARLWFEAGFRRPTTTLGKRCRMVKTVDFPALPSPHNKHYMEVTENVAGYRLRVNPALRPDRRTTEVYPTNEEAFAAYTAWLLTGNLYEPELWPKRRR